VFRFYEYFYIIIRSNCRRFIQIKPILKYAGGKAREIKYFSKYFPSSFDRYIEPFVGGGAVYFHLQPEKAFINDLNSDLINFYQQVQTNSELLIDIIKDMPIDKDTYNQIRSAKYEAPFKRALRYFYLNKTAYSGLMRYNSKGEFNTPYGNYKNPNFTITQEQIDLLRSAEIHNCDFREIPITYKTNDFIFCDPPYVETWKGYNKLHFSDEDQKELYHWFLGNTAQIMIVINKVDWIAKMYERFIKDEYQTTYGIDVNNGNKKIKTHLVITNY